MNLNLIHIYFHEINRWKIYRLRDLHFFILISLFHLGEGENTKNKF